jgi:DNA adenine methylase
MAGGSAVKVNPLARPFLKWAGGKRQLLHELRKYAPPIRGVRGVTYFEPFVGGGALLFGLQPDRAVISDSNSELINCYQVVKESVDELIAELRSHRNEEDYYYDVREWDRSPDYLKKPPAKRAARIIFLNKTCYNGLFRVNSQGQFNVPFGRYTDPNIVDEAVLRAVSAYLNGADVTMLVRDFEEAVRGAKRNDFVYCDPPYDPVSSTAAFTGYDVNGFDKKQQVRLRDVVNDLTRRGCRVLVSNASTDFIENLYPRVYRRVKVEAARPINSYGDRRGKVDEILIMNYNIEQLRKPRKPRVRKSSATDGPTTLVMNYDQ